MVNQSMVSGGAPSANSNSTAPVGGNPQYAQSYHGEIQTMFMTNEFKTGTVHDKKEMIGNTIYKHVEKIVGDGKAPKITGMLIDLPEVELNFSISTWNNFFTKVQSAFNLIQESENRAPAASQGPPPAADKV